MVETFLFVKKRRLEPRFHQHDVVLRRPCGLPQFDVLLCPQRYGKPICMVVVLVCYMIDFRVLFHAFHRVQDGVDTM